MEDGLQRQIKVAQSSAVFDNLRNSSPTKPTAYTDNGFKAVSHLNALLKFDVLTSLGNDMAIAADFKVKYPHQSIILGTTCHKVHCCSGNLDAIKTNRLTAILTPQILAQKLNILKSLYYLVVMDGMLF